MTDTTPYEVFCKLIGDIRPVGETYHDEQVLNNLGQYLFCLQWLVEDLADKVLSAPYYGEASIYKAKHQTVCKLRQMRDCIDEIVRDAEREICGGKE